MAKIHELKTVLGEQVDQEMSEKEFFEECAEFLQKEVGSSEVFVAEVADELYWSRTVEQEMFTPTASGDMLTIYPGQFYSFNPKYDRGDNEWLWEICDSDKWRRLWPALLSANSEYFFRYGINLAAEVDWVPGNYFREIKKI